MTAIAGFVENKHVWIGGDSAGVGPNYSLERRADEKVFQNGPFLFGFTSSFRMGQLLRYSFDPPPRPADMDVYKFMTTIFIDAVRKCLKDGGFATKNNEVEVSEVTRDNHPNGNFSDVKAIGPILSVEGGGWVRDGRKGQFDSVIPADLTF